MQVRIERNATPTGLPFGVAWREFGKDKVTYFADLAKARSFARRIRGGQIVDLVRPLPGEGFTVGPNGPNALE